MSHSSDVANADDLVERLRDRDAVVLSGLFHAIPAMNAAADEITRLRSLLAAAEARNEIARKALDNSDWSDARRIHEATLALRYQSSGGGNG